MHDLFSLNKESNRKVKQLGKEIIKIWKQQKNTNKDEMAKIMNTIDFVHENHFYNYLKFWPRDAIDRLERAKISHRSFNN